ncbi:hypothetical protein [Variovorax sp. UC122_21]|uniref:hypothetical protein n=1 Tax=Variovorax sp. UC122_21 TaxID=3374554 RepID=UPI0037578BCA
MTPAMAAKRREVEWGFKLQSSLDRVVKKGATAVVSNRLRRPAFLAQRFSSMALGLADAVGHGAARER